MRRCGVDGGATRMHASSVILGPAIHRRDTSHIRPSVTGNGARRWTRHRTQRPLQSSSSATSIQASMAPGSCWCLRLALDSSSPSSTRALGFAARDRAAGGTSLDRVRRQAPSRTGLSRSVRRSSRATVARHVQVRRYRVRTVRHECGCVQRGCQADSFVAMARGSEPAVPLGGARRPRRTSRSRIGWSRTSSSVTPSVVIAGLSHACVRVRTRRPVRSGRRQSARPGRTAGGRSQALPRGRRWRRATGADRAARPGAAHPR